MSTENVAIMHRIYEVLNGGNMDLADQVIAADSVSHEVPPEYPSGLEGWKQYFTDFRAAFPDLHFTVEETIAEGDKVVCRCTLRGTHRGDFMGIPATGKQVVVTGVDVGHFANGKGVEHWAYYDELGMMQQLGVIPSDGP